jgi:hypothetical protein
MSFHRTWGIYRWMEDEIWNFLNFLEFKQSKRASFEFKLKTWINHELTPSTRPHGSGGDRYRSKPRGLLDQQAGVVPTW